MVYEIAKDARYSVEMFGDPSNEEAEMIWALVDDTAMVRHPVPFLMRSQRFRIIQSTTSRSERWIRYKNGAASFYYMEPFSWKEIMQGSVREHDVLMEWPLKTGENPCFQVTLAAVVPAT